MANKIFKDFQGNTVRVDGICYTFIGETTSGIDTTPAEIQGAYASCLECNVDSSSESSSSSSSDGFELQIQLKEHDQYTPANVNVTFSKPSSTDIRVTHNGGSNGSGYIMLHFPTEVARDKYITFQSTMSVHHVAEGTNIGVYDGIILRTDTGVFPSNSAAVFPPRLQPISAQGGPGVKNISILLDFNSIEPVEDFISILIRFQEGHGNSGTMTISNLRLTNSGDTVTYYEYDEGSLSMDVTGTLNDYGTAGNMIKS